MNILCIETGTDVCSVGLVRDGGVVALRENGGDRDHARHVAVYAREVLMETGLAASELDAVAVSKGPGSYTGLRIGVSFAKGLCYGLRVPLIGVGSLESLVSLAIDNFGAEAISSTCMASRQRTLFIPMIDARRMEIYARVFDASGRALSEVEAVVVDENSFADFRRDNEGRDRQVFIFGDGAAKCRRALPWADYIDVGASARGMARLATQAFEARRFEDVAYFEPFYLKDFVITTSKKSLTV